MKKQYCSHCDKKKYLINEEMCAECDKEIIEENTKDPFNGDTAEYIINKACDGSDYNRGSVETAKAQAYNASGILARLIQHLYDKGELTKEDVLKFTRGY